MNPELYQHANGMLVMMLETARLWNTTKDEYVIVYQTLGGFTYAMDALQFRREFRRINDASEIRETRV